MPENNAVGELNRKALQALDKKAAYGSDIDIKEFRKEPAAPNYPADLAGLTGAQSEAVLKAGVDVSQKNRSGTFLQMDHSVIHAGSVFPGLEVMSITNALEKFEWLYEYYWKAVGVDQDKYTAYAQLNPYHGYFIRAFPGIKAAAPCQACLYLMGEDLVQSVHNIIIAEEGADLQVITGCATSLIKGKGMHIGISEFYVKKNARITFTMVHNWAENIAVRPRTGVIVEEGGIFLSNYICLNPVKSLQMYPKAVLAGRNSTARYNSILYSGSGSSLDVGSRVILSAPDTRAEIIAHAISNNGEIFTRGNLRAEAIPAKAHLECKGMITGKKGSIIAVP
jgi:Fe-S cluster assembly scaffold protein SufB